MNPEPPPQATAEDVMRFAPDSAELRQAKEDLLAAGLTPAQVDELYREALTEHVSRQLGSRQQRRAAERAARKAEHRPGPNTQAKARGVTTDRQAWLGKLAKAISVQG